MEITLSLVVSLTCCVLLVLGESISQRTLESKYSLSHKNVRSDHWAFNLTTPEIIEHFGYPVEIHSVTTEDGYILELHRIPHGIAGPSKDPLPIAYLEHCLLCSSSDYIMNDPSEALAYVLADAGYDVWLSNMRGNTYSRKHTTLDPDDIEFWQFNWDEMAYYDVPASIDYVLENTESDGVHYVGWSMGTTVFWALMSERPEYNDKIKAMAAMAPVAYVNHATGAVADVAQLTAEMEGFFEMFGIGEMMPDGAYMDYLAENYCDLNSTYSEICYNALFLLCGPDADELDKEYLPIILSHTPAGSSVHTVAHFGQMVMSGEFCKYDYGPEGNLEHYGQDTPPLYDLGKVTAPVGIFWGNTDTLVVQEDLDRLIDSLPNVVLNYNVPRTEWSHLDFGWAIHANEYVYTEILKFFSNY